MHIKLWGVLDIKGRLVYVSSVKSDCLEYLTDDSYQLVSDYFVLNFEEAD